MYLNKNQKAHTIYMNTALSWPYFIHITSGHNIWLCWTSTGRQLRIL